MNEKIGDYDNVRVYFKDESSTLIWVHKDNVIQDAILELCENQGWDMRDVTNYKIER